MSQDRPQGTVEYGNHGRVAVVSGGCSGIGSAICRAFAETHAAGVLCLDIDKARAADLPNGVRFYRCDTSSEDECREAIAWTIEQFGALDILVNNAAIQPQDSYSALHDLPMSVWHRMLATNFSGYTYLAKYALQQMCEQESGVVVNIASAQGHRTAREVGAYGPIRLGSGASNTLGKAFVLSPYHPALLIRPWCGPVFLSRAGRRSSRIGIRSGDSANPKR